MSLVHDDKRGVLGAIDELPMLVVLRVHPAADLLIGVHTHAPAHVVPFKQRVPDARFERRRRRDQRAARGSNDGSIAALVERVAAEPRVTAYLASDRRMAFNEDGIFRNYPELDAD